MINVEGALEVENHLQPIAVKIESGKNHRWMLILGGNFNKDLCSTLTYLPNKTVY